MSPEKMWILFFLQLLVKGGGRWYRSSQHRIILMGEYFFHKICKSFFLTLSLIACYNLQITMDFNHKYDNDYNILPVKTNRMSTFKSK